MSRADVGVSALVLRVGARLRNLNYQAAVMGAFLVAPHVVPVLRGAADGWDWLLGVFWILFTVGSLVVAVSYGRKVDRGDWIGVLRGE